MVPTQDRPLNVSIAGLLGLSLLGIFWAISSFAKLAAILDTLWYGVSFSRITYVDAFPRTLIVAVIASEAIVAFLLLAGRATSGLALGCALLVAFSIVLAVFPPAPHTPCGCAGELESLVFPAGVSPIARNIFLLGVHGFVLVLSSADSRVKSASNSAAPV